MRITAPYIRGWGRLSVKGLDTLPASGPVLLCGNHDSYWDPLAVGVAAFPKRQIRALAKASLWDVWGVGTVLTHAGHIPIDRGKGDRGALDRAAQELREGACIGVFLEGTRSLGRPLRARSGFGHLAAQVPEAEIVCARVNGAVDLPRVGVRPSASVEFFRPAGGGMQAGEEPQAFCQRLLDEIREGAPRAIAGRKRRAAAARGDLAAMPE
jgi:1-acyl-sn-glycerol-3-phosphate acyltransferase